MTSRMLPVLEPSLQGRAPGVPRRPSLPPERLVEFALDSVSLPRFHVWTLGCQMNQSDSEEMAGALLAAGCEEAPSLESADLIVINSCSVRETAENKIVGRQGQLAKIKAANPAVRVVLAGCAVHGEDRRRLARRYAAVDVFLRPDEEPELTVRLGLASSTAPGGLSAGGSSAGGSWPPALGPELAGREGPVGRSLADRLGTTRAAALREGRVARRGAIAAWLPIIYGCDKTCTYCIVPLTRGPERSRPFDDVVAEARQLAAAGYREVTLLGQNVNSYGHDLSADSRFEGVMGERELGRRLDLAGRPDIAALLAAIDGIRGEDGRPAIPRLRFITSHPWDLSDRLIAAIADCPSVCEHLHLPVQSGSNEVLRRMGRQYTVESYRRLIDRLRDAVPHIGLTTDVIVGFCGETGAQFEETMGLLREVRFDTLYAAAYSPRPGTPATAMPDDVPPAEKKRRLNELLAVQEGIGLERNRALVGRVAEVLVDQVRSRRSHEHSDAPGEGTPRVRVSGRTRDNRLVHLDGTPDLVGRLVRVRIDHAGPYALSGSLVADGTA